MNLVLFTGSGGCFSAGRLPVPRDEITGEETTGSPADHQQWIAGLRVANNVAELPVPVIMALNGDALDHGLELALAGDIRLADENARFGLTDLASGGFPWDGGTQRLPRLVGPAWAQDLILTNSRRPPGVGAGPGEPGDSPRAGLGRSPRIGGADFARRAPCRPLCKRSRLPGGGPGAPPGLGVGGRPEHHPSKHSGPGRGIGVICGKAAPPLQWSMSAGEGECRHTYAPNIRQLCHTSRFLIMGSSSL